MCTFLQGGERPFFLVGGGGISVLGSMVTFMQLQHNTKVACTCVASDVKPAKRAMTPRVLRSKVSKFGAHRRKRSILLTTSMLRS